MGKIIPTKIIAAALAGCAPQDLLVFRELEDGSAVVVIPTGQKYKYTPEQLAQFETHLYTVATDVGLDVFRPEVETAAAPAARAPVTNRKGGSVPANDEAPDRTNAGSSPDPAITKTHPSNVDPNPTDPGTEIVPNRKGGSVPANRRGGSVPAKDVAPDRTNTSNPSSPATAKTHPRSHR